MPAHKQRAELAFETIVESFLQQYDFSPEELHAIINEHAMKIPVTAFSVDLTPLEVLVRYIDDDKQLSKMLERPLSTFKQARKNSYKKIPDKIVFREEGAHIPLSALRETGLSPFESIVMYLRGKGHTNNQIAEWTGRDARVIATVLNRARKKRGERT